LSIEIPQAYVDHFCLQSYPGASDASCGPGPSPSSSSHLYYPHFVPRHFPSTKSSPPDLSMDLSLCSYTPTSLLYHLKGSDRDVHLRLILQEAICTIYKISESTRNPQDPQDLRTKKGSTRSTRSTGLRRTFDLAVISVSTDDPQIISSLR